VTRKSAHGGWQPPFLAGGENERETQPSAIDSAASSDYRCLDPMNFLRHKWFRLVAVFAFCVITGDLVADAVHDERGSCATESQSGDHDSCPTCACSLHVGTALVPPPPAFFPPVELMALLTEPLAPGAVRDPGEVEHPPQLA
jgi:hypothetical protein